MLAVPLQFTLGNPLGVVVDGSNNNISAVTPDGAASMVGVMANDLITAIDGTVITEFEMQPGPIGDTLLITSEPQSVMAAAAAIDPTADEHIIHVLRQIDPNSVSMSPPLSAAPPSPTRQPRPPLQMQPPQPPQPPPPPPQPVAQKTAQFVSPQEELESHYPWAVEAIADNSKGEGHLKGKYNLPSGTALPPMTGPLQRTHDAAMRKAAAFGSNFHTSLREGNEWRTRRTFG